MVGYFVPPGPSAYPTSLSPSRVLSHNYEIDLTDDHADALREAFSDYVAAALKITDRAGRTSAGAAPKRGNSEELAKVREWANTNGHEVSSRGRISQAVRDAYDDAAPQTKRPATPSGWLAVLAHSGAAVLCQLISTAQKLDEGRSQDRTRQ